MRALHAALSWLGCSAALLPLGLFWVSPVSAQAPVDPEATPEAEVPPGRTDGSPAAAEATPASAQAEPARDVPAAVPTGADAALSALKAELAETRRRLEAVEAREDAAEDAAALGDDDGAPEEEALKIYGFADMGVQRQWVDESSLIANVFPVNSTSFVIGNVNIYFDAQPVEHWRGLVELRFTNAPLGDIDNLGGLAGTFARKSTFSYDPHGTAINAPMWGGSVVLERAWLEWNQLQSIKLRVGNWFTPFGIWNEDHGSPTLITMALPQFILQRWMPIRQTGLMAYGNSFAGDWELGYALTFSNGRQELSNYNFEDKFGYGGRLYARRETGTFNTTIGLSYFTGTSSDISINVTSLTPVSVDTQKTWEYTEHVLGADLAIDIDATRIRAEGIVRRQTFTPGHRLPGDPVYGIGSFETDKWQHSAYLLVAHQLPWAGIEPFVFGELMQAPSVVGDGVLVGSAGVNVHFNAAIQWKTQLTRGVFFDWAYESPYDNSVNNLTAVYSRIVMAF